MNLWSYIIYTLDCQCIFKFKENDMQHKYAEINILIKLLIYSTLMNYNNNPPLYATSVLLLIAYLLINVYMSYRIKTIVENELTTDKVTLIEMLLLLANSLYIIGIVIPLLLKMHIFHISISLYSFYTILVTIGVILTYFSQVHFNILDLLQILTRSDSYVTTNQNLSNKGRKKKCK